MDEVDEVLAKPSRRTCEEVPGCTNPTVSDRGRYARVCTEHKALVTARYQGRRKPKSEAVPPPAPEPDGRHSVDKTDPAPSLVGLAERVDTLSTRRRAMLAELDDLEAELRDALGACQEALSACESEVAA